MSRATNFNTWIFLPDEKIPVYPIGAHQSDEFSYQKTRFTHNDTQYVFEENLI